MKNIINNIEIIHGDLTKMNLDIIVNAANHTLLGGGGIDGIIHYKAGPELLEECKKLNGCAEKYRTENKLKTITIGFPCISTGIYRYPKDEACKIAIDTIREYTNMNIKVKFVCYDELDYKLYINYINEINNIELN